MKKVDRNIYKHKIFYIIAFIIFNIVLLLTAMSGRLILNIIGFTCGIVIIGHFLYNDSKIYLLYYCIFAICFLFIDLLSTIVIQTCILATGAYFVSLAYLQIITIFSWKFIHHRVTHIY